MFLSMDPEVDSGRSLSQCTSTQARLMFGLLDCKD
jgi:hypothetical protein